MQGGESVSQHPLTPPRRATAADRRFLITFALAVALTVSPLIGLSIRLVALGEILEGVVPAPAQLYGPLYADFPTYKVDQARRLHPELLVIGSSRVMQFRESMFAGCDGRRNCFYNAGGAMPTMRAGIDFLRALGRDNAPRAILLGIDIWQFDPNFDPGKHNEQAVRVTLPQRLGYALSVVRDVGATLPRDPVLRDVVLGTRSLPSGMRGLTAILHTSGFRGDGSYAYGPEVVSRVASLSTSERSSSELERIATQGARFEYFERADQRSLAELEELSALARNYGAAIIVFTPPFSDDIAAAIDAQPGLRAGFADVERSVGERLSRAAVPYFIARSFAGVGCLDHERFDGYHPSEVCNARLLTRLMADPAIASSLGPYVSVDDLQRLIASHRSPFSIRDDQ